MLRKLCSSLAVVAVFLTALTLAGCASDKKPQPQMMTGDQPAPAHERHATGISSHVHQE